MSMDSAAKELILKNRAAADAELAAVRAAKNLTLSQLHTHLSLFVLFKFQLSPAEAHTESIAELAALSLAKSAKLSKELAEQIDNAKSCDGATSAMVKKALLFTAIQRGLEITLPPKAVVRCKTLRELTADVWDVLPENVRANP